MMHCNKCSADLHYECIALRKEDDPDNPGIVLFSCCCIGKSIEPTIISSTGKEYRDEDDVERGNGGRMLKEGENMRDVESTGRKRAAQAAPINPLMPCEWQGLKSAGGGVFPIIGCRDSTQVDRHHGPDKGTLNNAVGTNLHRICKRCHNRWHTLNDPMYPSKRPAKGASFLPLSGDVIPHDPLTKATLKEQFDNEVFWATPKASRAVEEKEQENDSTMARGLAEGTRPVDEHGDRPSEPDSGILL